MLFRYALCAINLISTFSLQHILIRYQGLYYCHWVASLHGINSQVSSAASAATCVIIAFLLHTKLEYPHLYLNKYIRYIVAVCFIGEEALNISTETTPTFGATYKHYIVRLYRVHIRGKGKLSND
jgi:hypothetical protein